jgi:hypothetical protein
LFVPESITDAIFQLGPCFQLAANLHGIINPMPSVIYAAVPTWRKEIYGRVNVISDELAKLYREIIKRLVPGSYLSFFTRKKGCEAKNGYEYKRYELF